MIHPDLIEFRRELDNIFEMAKPLFEQKELIEKIKSRVKELDKRISEKVKNHPEMCNSACPDEDYCSQQVDGKCPKIKSDVVTL